MFVSAKKGDFKVTDKTKVLPVDLNEELHKLIFYKQEVVGQRWKL